jgi:hypothetical protein
LQLETSWFSEFSLINMIYSDDVAHDREIGMNVPEKSAIVSLRRFNLQAKTRRREGGGN